MPTGAAWYRIESLERRVLLTSVTVNSGAPFNFSNTVHLDSLTINGGGVATFAAGGDKQMILHGLTINSGGKLVLNDNDLVLFYSGASPLGTIRQYIATGQGGASGITNTVSRSVPSTYAIFDNIGPRFPIWEDEVLNNGSGNFNQVIVRYTHVGDVNLDGRVTSADYAIIDANLGRTGANWVQGDLNSDGTVTAADRALVDASFGAGVIVQTPFFGTPISLPGFVEVENFDKGNDGVAFHDTSRSNLGGTYRSGGVDVEACGDGGGGNDVGYTRAGEWLKYTVNVTQAGAYNVNFRLANSTAGGLFHLEVDGVNATGGIAVPNTGSFFNWQTVTRSISLPAGQHVLRLAFDGVASSGFAGSFNWFEVAAAQPVLVRSPFNATPASLPGIVEAENFDVGNEGVTYHDNDATNRGGKYRDTGVDIEATSDSGGGFNVAYGMAGEWLEYTVDVAAAGNYDTLLRVANPSGGGKLHLEMDGVNITGSLVVPGTASFGSYANIGRPAVGFTAGRHVLRVVFEKNAGNGFVGNLNWISVQPSAAVRGPFSGTPITIPGRVEAENFDQGPEGDAYHDTDNLNQGLLYRVSGVDIESTADIGFGYNVGYVAAGEWLEYSVNVTTAGLYTADFRVANSGAGGALHLDVDGVNASGAMSIPNTGSFTTFKTISKPQVALSAGPHILRLAFDTAASNGFVGNVNWFALTPTVSVTVMATDAAAAETAADPGTFTFTRSSGSDQPLVVFFSVGGTATDGTDYEVIPLNPPMVTIPAGATSATVSVVPIDDTNAEPDETVVLTIVPGPVYILGAATTATVTIADNENQQNGPYTGTPAAVPGTIQAENFDLGPDGIAYHDLTGINEGGQYRATAVDIQSTTDSGGGYNVGWIKAGEFLAYTVDVASSANYVLDLRLAASGTGGSVHVEVDGIAASGGIGVPNTGGFQTWQTVSRTVSLAAGQHLLRVAFDTNGSSGYVGNLNWVRLTQSAELPFLVVPFVPPAVIQAEDFDSGGEGLGYHDLDSANLGGQYRTGDGVDIEVTNDVGGGFNVGYAKAGEWLAYTIDVPGAGDYRLDLRVAAKGAGGTLHGEFAGVNKTGAIGIADTGGWQVWQTISRTVTLAAGPQILRIVFDGNGSGGYAGNLNWLTLTAL